MKYNFCKIYLSCTKPLNVIEEDIKLIFGSNESKIDFYIDENDEYDVYKEKDFPDGFLFFKYTIDISFPDDFSKLDCVNYINKVLTMFWENEFPAIASYDFENELVKKGGYKSQDIPWFN